MANSVVMKKLFMAAAGAVFIALGATGKAEALTLNGPSVNSNSPLTKTTSFSVGITSAKLEAASASTIDFGSWYEFSFGQVGEDAQGCYPADPFGGSCTPSSAGNSLLAGPSPWEFEVGAAGAILKVTDAFFRGDTFDIFNFDTLIGTTSQAFPQENGCGSNPETCFADALMSKGTFNLAQGKYSLRIVPTNSPFGRGAAYFRVDRQVKEVPEPALIFGLLAFGVMGIAKKYNQ